MAQSSNLFTIGTLLRHAQDAGAPVRVLVSNTWVDGVVVGADGHGVVLDDGNGHQVLVKLDAILAVSFSRSAIDDPPDGDRQSDAHTAWHTQREPIEAGPVGSS
jgi:hypothetical protein